MIVFRQYYYYYYYRYVIFAFYSQKFAAYFTIDIVLWSRSDLETAFCERA